MQIKAVTVNAACTTVVQKGQKNATSLQAGNSMLSPQCRVSISKEGKRLSGQQNVQRQENFKEAAVRRVMLRRDEESEQNKKITDGYREQLNNIQKEIRSLNKSYTASASKETVEKEQAVLRAMREQKQFQMEENQRRAKEAQELAAMQSSKYQDEIDGNNRQLWVLLKTLEEAEKAKEERKGDYTEDDGGSNMPEAQNSVSDTIQNSATKFVKESVRRDQYAYGKLEGLIEEGHRLIKLANEITNNILKASENAMAALDDENHTDDMRAELTDNLQGAAMSGYSDVAKYRSNGLHMLQTARDYKLKRIADDPLAGMQETKEGMMLSASDIAIGEEVRSRLDETSKEIAKEVQELIDERNDVNRALEEEKEEQRIADEKAENEKAEDEAAEDKRIGNA